ncbi:DUF3618 domain-containing protein [Pseudonocardia pini]|uniref:DUF3618 domain-containing protein n=1 Tax=Pseudonocardia pini TaxID=2758030 RepID=UPI0015F06AD0|nr:DUF3618 domain-containing protein [Pseudonocardia pini]
MSPDRDPEELRAKIAQEREALGETAAALAERADVTGRAKESARQTVESVRGNASHVAAQAQQQGGRALEQATTWVSGVVDRARTGEDRRPLFVVGAILGALVTVLAVRTARR